MRQTVYVPCPLTREITRERADDRGFNYEETGEVTCEWDVEFIVTRYADREAIAAVQQEECDRCNKGWTEDQLEKMQAQAIEIAREEPFDFGEPLDND